MCEIRYANAGDAKSLYEKIGFKFDGTVNEISIGKKLNEVRYVKKIE